MLREIYFLLFTIITLNSLAQSYKDPYFVDGRTVFIHLFEWKWGDIAAECERFLAPKGYGGVQVSPPQEHPQLGYAGYPWWQRYQPASYRLISRSGNEQEFRDMVERCNRVGVRIYVDAIINHMAHQGNIGTGGSHYNSGQRSFPGVPYSIFDFNDRLCKSHNGKINSYQNVEEVRNCKLGDLPDLAQGNEYVRNKIIDYMNKCIDLGVAGFRIDAAKHMWPGDLQNIFSRLKNLREDVFGPNKRPFIYQEVIDQGGEPIKASHYTHLGQVSEFKYGLFLSQVFTKSNNQRLANLRNFGSAWSLINDHDAQVFIDNHDNQRGHGGGGNIITHKQSRLYKMVNAFGLAWPYGTFQVMSSYSFSNGDQGPPSGPNGFTHSVQVNNDDTCSGGWVCEHRWRQIYNMVRFRNIAGREGVRNWWDNGNNQVAFSRGNRAFLAINNDPYMMDVTLQTGLPGGDYCDIISGNKINNSCTGKVIKVNGDGTTRIQIRNQDYDPMVAFHVESKL